jgi:Uma2 family endonuclease
VNPKRKTVTVYSPQAEPQIVTVNDLLEGQGVLPGFRYSIVKMFPKD